MTTRARIGFGAIAIVGGVLGLGLYLLFRVLSESTTLSVGLTAEGQPLAPGEMPRLLWDGGPIANGGKVRPGKGTLTTESEIFQGLKEPVDIRLGKPNCVQFNLVYRCGSIEISTLPPGAEVFQAGRSLGKTPLELSRERVGPHQYSVSLKGWDDAVLNGLVKDGERLVLNHRFPHGRVLVGSEPAGASVMHQGSVLGKTPIELECVPAGAISYEVALDGWRSAALTGTVEDGKDLKLNHHFPNGSLTVITDPPGACVKHGERVLGTTPLELKQLPEGGIELTVELKDHRGVTLSALIRDNETFVLRERLVSFEEEARQRAEEARKLEAERVQAEARRQKEIAEVEIARKRELYTTGVYGRWVGKANYKAGLFSVKEFVCTLSIEPGNDVIEYVISNTGKSEVEHYRIQSMDKMTFVAEGTENSPSHYKRATFVIDGNDRNTAKLTLYVETRVNAIIINGEPLTARNAGEVVLRRNVTWFLGAGERARQSSTTSVASQPLNGAPAPIPSFSITMPQSP